MGDHCAERKKAKKNSRKGFRPTPLHGSIHILKRAWTTVGFVQWKCGCTWHHRYCLEKINAADGDESGACIRRMLRCASVFCAGCIIECLHSAPHRESIAAAGVAGAAVRASGAICCIFYNRLSDPDDGLRAMCTDYVAPGRRR